MQHDRLGKSQILTIKLTLFLMAPKRLLKNAAKLTRRLHLTRSVHRIVVVMGVRAVKTAAQFDGFILCLLYTSDAADE